MSLENSPIHFDQTQDSITTIDNNQSRRNLIDENQEDEAKLAHTFKMINKLNSFARECLDVKDFDSAYKVLKKCEQKLAVQDRWQHQPALLTLTYKNLAQYYRLKNKPLIAVKYLQHALHIELSNPSTPLEIVAETKLDLCAVLSQLGKHKLAREFAKGAVSNIQNSASAIETAQNTQSSYATKDTGDLLATAYYNLGVENEHLRDLKAARDCYEKSELGQQILPDILNKAEERERESLRRLEIRQKNTVAQLTGFSAKDHLVARNKQLESVDEGPPRSQGPSQLKKPKFYRRKEQFQQFSGQETRYDSWHSNESKNQSQAGNGSNTFNVQNSPILLESSCVLSNKSKDRTESIYPVNVQKINPELIEKDSQYKRDNHDLLPRDKGRSDSSFDNSSAVPISQGFQTFHRPTGVEQPPKMCDSKENFALPSRKYVSRIQKLDQAAQQLNSTNYPMNLDKSIDLMPSNQKSPRTNMRNTQMMNFKTDTGSFANMSPHNGGFTQTKSGFKVPAICLNDLSKSSMGSNQTASFIAFAQTSGRYIKPEDNNLMNETFLDSSRTGANTRVRGSMVSINGRDGAKYRSKSKLSRSVLATIQRNPLCQSQDRSVVRLMHNQSKQTAMMYNSTSQFGHQPSASPNNSRNSPLNAKIKREAKWRNTQNLLKNSTINFGIPLPQIYDQLQKGQLPKQIQSQQTRQKRSGKQTKRLIKMPGPLPSDMIEHGKYAGKLSEMSFYL